MFFPYLGHEPHTDRRSEWLLAAPDGHRIFPGVGSRLRCKQTSARPPPRLPQSTPIADLR